MGQTLLRLLSSHADVDLVGGIGRAGSPVEPVASGHNGDSDARPRVVTLDEAPAMIANADVVIDFSAPPATRQLLEHASDALRGRALIVGTTGLDDSTRRKIDEMADRAAILTAANFSLGINLLLGLAQRVAQSLDPAAYDVEITERHHRRKTDAPSGTALALGDAVAAGRGVGLDNVRRDGRTGQTGARTPGEIGFHALRGGGVIGEHSVLFFGERELIELRHEALDRSVFADGALTAARWIAGRAPGRYTMHDVLEL